MYGRTVAGEETERDMKRSQRVVRRNYEDNKKKDTLIARKTKTVVTLPN